MPIGPLIDGATPLVAAVSARRRVERGLRVAVLAALSALLMFGPLALGVVQDWSIALFEAAAAGLFLLCVGWKLTGGGAGLRWNPLFAPMLAFAALVLAQIALRQTAYLYDSLSELWLYIAYGMLAWVAAQVLNGENVQRFAQALGAFGGLYALFAVVQSLTSDGLIYWRIRPQAGNIYGAYVNHNHYAGLMELLLPFALVLGFSGTVRGGKRLLWLAAATLMAASVFLCQSRGGMFALVVETAGLALFWMRQFSPRRSAALFVGFCLATALVLAWIAPQQLGSRMTDLHDPARWLIHRDALGMFAAHPFVGSGFGTFATVFPAIAFSMTPFSSTTRTTTISNCCWKQG